MTSRKHEAQCKSEFRIHKTIKHRRQNDALDELQFLLHHGNGFELLTLVGPSGAGKSALCETLVEKIRLQACAEMERDPDHVPAIMTPAVAEGHRAFEWKGLYRAAAEAVGDPFAWQRRPKPEVEKKHRRFMGEHITTAAYRRSMEQEFAHRRTKYWFIDEAQHILTGAKAGTPGDQFDVLKSVAQTSSVKIVLVGPYSLLTHIDNSAQLARRTHCVHLPRYKSKEISEKNSFASCAAALLKQLPLDEFPDVEGNFDFYYAGSAGCIGILKEWCERAAERMWLEGGQRVLTRAHFAKTRLRTDALQRIYMDLFEGEALLELGTEEEVLELEELTFARYVAAAKDQPLAAKGKSDKPGTRRPGRDPVPPVIGGRR